ncbi:HAMP domain-containing protein [Candidatus Gracilibacteria bacterium]|nr:HAMP domain-containing protein [Candidatus Gracilibacteria bacterium]
MRLLFDELRSRLQYKIIIPFVLLTLCIGLAGSAVVFSLVAESWQERLDNQLAVVTRAAGDALVIQEQANLQFLREVAFAGRNEATGAPAVADAVANADSAGLLLALDPYFQSGIDRPGVRLDRMLLFDRSGLTLADLERGSGVNNSSYSVNEALDLSDTWFAEQVLAAGADDQGDKYAGLLRFADNGALYFATIAPVRQGETVVGGIIVAMRADNLLGSLQNRSQSAAISLYDDQGAPLESTLVAGPGDISPLNPALLERYRANSDPSAQAVYDVVSVGGRDYQFAFVPLRIRNSNVGILAPALSRDYIVGAWSSAREPIIAFIAVLMLMVIVLGIFIARMITRPLEELVLAARAVTAGELDRRANVSARDEIGVLSSSFNTMTAHLLQLYAEVQKESSQRAAIVESITDGIIVCEDDGAIVLINKAMRKLLSLAEADAAPARLADIRLEKMTEGVPGFGSQRAADLYTLGEYIVRAAAAPVVTAEGQRRGYVLVLQDMTSEVAVDRAKTGFIGTISHELRTPLTVIRGNSDLLMRGLVGPLDEEQRSFIESIRQHANNMTNLLSNVIIIAGLDSGSLATDINAIAVLRPIEEAAWPLRSAIKQKGLSFDIDVPDDLPQVLADFDQVRMIMHQLIDNARRYTAQGGIVVRAYQASDLVVVEVVDSGRGISSDMQPHLFQRFMRGDGANEGINSNERGIGLGLAIARQLVERQGGTISVESTLGQGSTFRFTLRNTHDSQSPEKSSSPFAAAA